ncbi:MAG: polysaccharide deacetylase family protein [Butyricicoccaceae bacterium]
MIDIRAGKEAMPERPVMITFDDGYRSNYDIAYPILQKTGMKAVIALIGKSIRANDNTEANRFFLKWDEASEMADSGLVELASHTYNLHNPQYGGLTAPDGINGIQRLKGESQAAYNKRVGEDLKQSIDLITQNTSQKNVLFFAYPFGARDEWMQPLLQKNGIQVSVLTNTGTASIRRRLTDLPRYRITMDTKLSDILPANPNASHDITVRAHMPTMIKNEKIRQEVARHLPAQERTIKIPKSYT